jgi:hypothetical protein
MPVQPVAKTPSASAGTTAAAAAATLPETAPTQQPAKQPRGPARHGAGPSAMPDTPRISAENPDEAATPRRRSTPRAASASAASVLTAAATKNGPSVLVSVGGGPRGETQALAEIDLINARRADFDRIQHLGGKYDIKTVIVERNAESSIGHGRAWGPEQSQGTANTGVEVSRGPGLLDYARRFRGHLETNLNVYTAQAQGQPIQDAVLSAAYDGSLGPAGQPAIQRSAMTRAQVGAEAADNFRHARAQAAAGIQFYRLEVMAHTNAAAIDLSDPSKPKLQLSDARTGASKGQLDANTVRLNTGTTLTPPISDAAVISHSFTSAMDAQAVKSFLAGKDLLDDNGMLKPDAKIALGGSGLSAYDQLLALNPVMKLFERDESAPLGYKVSEQAQQRYQGSITFVSNTEGKWIPPRHAHGPAWTQDTEPLGNAQEQHAMFLHQQGQEVFKAWGVLTGASVALAQGTVPKAVHQQGMSTAQLLAAQHASNVKASTKLVEARELHGDAKTAAIDQSTHTLEGARRQASLSTVLGLGMAREPSATAADMARLAPNTFAGREGYLMHRAQAKAVTEPGTPTSGDNKALLERFGAETMQDVTSSPMHVQDTVPQLMAAGIANYQAASYGNFKADGAAKPLSLTAHDGRRTEFDAFIVSSTFNLGAEPVLRSVGTQAKPAHPAVPHHPEVTSHRRIVDKDNQATAVEDFSLHGKGAKVPGTGNTSNAFAFDVNNRESAVHVAPALALRRMAHEHLRAAGFDNPAQLVDELYKKHLTSDDEHNHEAAGFAKHFDAGMVKAESLKAAAVAAGDDAQAFKRVAEAARAGSVVKTHASLIDARLGLDPVLNANEFKNSKSASSSLADGLAARPQFEPASNADYQKRFVDMPVQMHEQVYASALRLAEERLLQAQGS